MAKKGSAGKTTSKPDKALSAGKPSLLLDTRVIYGGDNVEQLAKLPDNCIDLIGTGSRDFGIDPPFNSNRNYEVFSGETKEKRSFEDRHASTAAYPGSPGRPRCVQLARVLKKTGSFYYRCDWQASCQKRFRFVNMEETMTTTLFPMPVAAEPPASGKITLLTPRDAECTIRAVEHATVMMLDPWYNKGVGGVREDYFEWLSNILLLASSRCDHIFLWGFPEIIWRVLPSLPAELKFVSWLTWYFKNCPSVIRGWRSAQMACLHFSKPGAKMYPEHFLNEAQLERKKNGKLRYMPGPATVIEVPLNIGFVGRDEQTGHPAQKPELVFEWLLRMTTKSGDLVCDPFCGSGTTGAACSRLNLNAILADHDQEYTKLAAVRLGLKPCRNMP